MIAAKAVKAIQRSLKRLAPAPPSVVAPTKTTNQYAFEMDQHGHPPCLCAWQLILCLLSPLFESMSRALLPVTSEILTSFEELPLYGGGCPKATNFLQPKATLLKVGFCRSCILVMGYCGVVGMELDSYISTRSTCSKQSGVPMLRD